MSVEYPLDHKKASVEARRSDVGWQAQRGLEVCKATLSGKSQKRLQTKEIDQRTFLLAKESIQGNDAEERNRTGRESESESVRVRERKSGNGFR